MTDSTIYLQKGRADNSRLTRAVELLPLDRSWEVVVRPRKSKRSDAQNAALFGYAYKLLSEFTGYTVPEIHDVMLRSYFGEMSKDVMGREIVKPYRTTTTDHEGKRAVLSKAEFADYFSHVQREAAQMGCVIPDPSLDHYLTDQEKAA